MSVDHITKLQVLKVTTLLIPSHHNVVAIYGDDWINGVTSARFIGLNTNFIAAK